jgi:hypothetical protein
MEVSKMQRVYVPLSNNERNALVKLAEIEHRDPRQQAALLIRQSLEKLRLLPPTPKPTQEAHYDRQAA